MQPPPIQLPGPVVFFLRWLPLAITGACVSYYFHFLHTHAINVPLADDIYDVLEVILDTGAAEGMREQLSILFAQHNDHRTLSSRLLYLAVYALSGEINFRGLVFIANLALPGFLALYWLALRRHPRGWWLVATAALCLCNLRSYGITLWSMAAFAYHFVFLYGFLAIYALHRATLPGFAAAVLLATLSTFTLASGQITWLVGLAFIWHQYRVARAVPATRLLAWVILAGLVLSLWRFHLATPNTLLAMLANFAREPGHFALYTLSLLGSFASETRVAAAATAGTALITALALASWRAWRSADIRLVACGWLVVLSAAAVVLGRAHFTTVDYALSARYAFPSVLMLSTTLVALGSQLQLRSLALPMFATAAAMYYCVFSYQQHGRALAPYTEQRVERFNKGQFRAYGKPLKQSNAIVARAVAQGIYQPPDRPLAVPGQTGAGRR